MAHSRTSLLYSLFSAYNYDTYFELLIMQILEFLLMNKESFSKLRFFQGGTVAHGPFAVCRHPGAEASAPPVNLYAPVKNVYPA